MCHTSRLGETVGDGCGNWVHYGRRPMQHGVAGRRDSAGYLPARAAAFSGPVN